MVFPDKPVAHLLGSNGPVHAVTYSASPGNYILTGSADRSIRLYNPFPSTSVPEVRPGAKPAVPQGRLIQTYAAHGYEVTCLAVAADNESFVSGGGDRAVFLWDVSRAVTTRRFGGSGAAQGGHSARVNCVSFAGEGDSLVASGGFDTTVRLWDVRNASGFRPVQVLDEAKDSVTSLVVRGAEVIAGSVDGRVRSYDVRMGKCTTDVMGASVVSLDVTRDGKAMLVGSLDSKLRLMDRDTGTCLRAYSDPLWKSEELRVQSLLGGREKYVVAGDEMTGDAAAADGSGSGRIWAWDLLSGKVVAKVTVPWGPPGYEARKKTVGKDGKPKVRSNVISCMAWREGGWGDQFCVGGTSGVVTVFGAL
ncbi:WD40-repeat-containing domain protein [Trichoderma gracile]